MGNESTRQKPFQVTLNSFFMTGFVTLAAISVIPHRAQSQDSSDAAEASSSREIDVEYAQANLRLANVELQLAEKYNRDVAKSIASRITLDQEDKSRMVRARQLSQVAIQRLKSGVAVAEAQLQEATSLSTGETGSARLRYVEEKLRLAKIRLDATKAKKPRDTEDNHLEIERARIKYELARLSIVKLSHPQHLRSVVDTLQLKTDRLSETVVALEQRIAALEDR